MLTENAQNDLDLNQVPTSEEEALMLYVGDKYDYYKKKWNIDSTGKPKLLSFNVGGFFGVSLWAAGRAMYSFAAYTIIFMFLADLLFLATGIALWQGTGYSAAFIVVYGLFGNYNYHYFATKKVKKLMAENKSRKEIMKAGGFLWRRFFAFLGLILLYGIVSVFVFGIE